MRRVTVATDAAPFCKLLSLNKHALCLIRKSRSCSEEHSGLLFWFDLVLHKHPHHSPTNQQTDDTARERVGPFEGLALS